MQLECTRKHACEYCGKSYVTSQYLRKHQRETCSSNPGSKDFLTRINKPFACLQCGTRYATKSGLNFHIRRECGQVQICHLCNDTFLHYSSLRKHIPRCRVKKQKYLI